VSAVTRFFLVAFGICWLITIPIALEVQGITSLQLVPRPAQWLIGFAPVIAAAWVTRGSSERGTWLAGALRLRVDYRWYLIALLLPWLVLGVTVLARSTAGLEVPRLTASPALAAFGVIWLVLAWGEEAGWRAYALPRMVGTWGFARAATLLGVLWCVWHYPKLFANPYLRLDAAGLTALAHFSVQILVANYFLAWLYLSSESAIVASVFHASWNLVSTVYPRAAIDPVVTALLLVTTVLVLVRHRPSSVPSHVSEG
jgi:uncharacterized protein